MQPRFEKRLGATPLSLVEQPRFRAGFDFLRLRADVNEIDESLADWWQEFSQADDTVREDLLQQVRAEQGARPRVRRVPRPDLAATQPQPSEGEQPAENAPARKRRRRRRKPGAGDAETT